MSGTFSNGTFRCWTFASETFSGPPFPPFVAPEMAVYYDILVAMQQQLRTRLTFSGQDGSGSVESDAIMIRKLPSALDPQSKWADEKTPGIILSPARRITRVQGNNERDFWQFPVLLQILHRSEDRAGDDAVMQSALDWEEKIAKYFHHGNLRLAVFSTPGFVFHTWTDSTDVLGEDRLRYHQDMVMALAVVAEAECPRDPNGAV